MDFGHKCLFPLRLRVALRSERNRNTIGVSIISRPATQRTTVTEILLNWTLQQQQNEHQVKPDSFVLYNRRLYHNFTKALSTLTTIVAEFGDCSRQCGQGLTSEQFLNGTSAQYRAAMQFHVIKITKIHTQFH